MRMGPSKVTGDRLQDENWATLVYAGTCTITRQHIAP